MKNKIHSPLNRTIRLDAEELAAPITKLSLHTNLSNVYQCDVIEALEILPSEHFELIVADPPYNYGVDFGNDSDKRTDEEYRAYAHEWVQKLTRVSKPTASFYICTGWEYSGFYQQELENASLTILNRITWKREKGRGASRNWKSNMEDIWFAVRDRKNYTFNLDAVKVRKSVIAPYRENGRPKDWTTDCEGKPYRMTHPSNIWTDLTVPFWSMRENTPHPTQKPEALAERIIVASSNPGDCVLDLFSGSGTFSVVAKKLGREFIGIEVNPEYIRYALKRLAMLDEDPQNLKK